jgi:hypothetical protein
LKRVTDVCPRCEEITAAPPGVRFVLVCCACSEQPVNCTCDARPEPWLRREETIAEHDIRVSAHIIRGHFEKLPLADLTAHYHDIKAELARREGPQPLTEEEALVA